MKLIKLAIVLFSLFLLTACGFGSSSSSVSSGNALSGKEGIVVSYVNNLPPSVIFYSEDNNEIDIELEAFNRGVIDSPRIRDTYFTGFDKEIITGFNSRGFQFGEGEAKTRFNPEGGYLTISEKMNIENLEDADTYEFTLKYVYCYDYQTKGAITICVDPEPNRPNKEDTCTPGRVTTAGQGAPISVDSVDLESMPGKVRAKFTIKDYSGGQVYSTNGNCRENIRSEQDKIKIDRIGLGQGSSNVDCSPDVGEELRLRDGTATFVCTFDLDETTLGSYTTLLNIDFSYQIKDSVQKNIKIINERDTN